MNDLPKIAELIVPILATLNENGPLNHQKIESKIVADLEIPNNLRHLLRSGNRTELNYRLSWARTKAKNLGYVIRDDSGLWKITEAGQSYLRK
jgi:restriction endonuclease Mrr